MVTLFRPAFSGREHAHVVLAGESFVTLEEGLQTGDRQHRREGAAQGKQGMFAPSGTIILSTQPL
jgi:hypothetical protein